MILLAQDTVSLTWQLKRIPTHDFPDAGMSSEGLLVEALMLRHLVLCVDEATAEVRLVKGNLETKFDEFEVMEEKRPLNALI